MVDNIFEIQHTFVCWVQMACSIASSTMLVAMVEATRQPTMRRA
jgi:hypothetical protein